MRIRGQLSLKEWAVVCEALGAGDQLLLLRKGGLGEKRGFEVAGTEFLLFPSFEHQHGVKVRPEHGGHFEAAAANRPPPGRLRIHLSARVVGSVALTVPGVPADAGEVFEATRDLHVYTPGLVAERVAYRPQAPLVAVVLEVRPLVEELDLVDERRFAGCRSWVDLPEMRFAVGEPALSRTMLDAAVERLAAGAPQPVGT